MGRITVFLSFRGKYRSGWAFFLSADHLLRSGAVDGYALLRLIAISCF